MNTPTRRITVGGVTIRYVQEMRTWMMVVEGTLEAEVIEALCEDLKSKLSAYFCAEVSWYRAGVPSDPGN